MIGNGKQTEEASIGTNGSVTYATTILIKGRSFAHIVERTCEENSMDELISRQAAIDALRAMQTYKLFAGDDMLLIDQAGAQTELMLLPPIQPKRGKWIRTGSGSLYDHYECSECGKAPKWECMGDNRWKIAFTGFCPNCGAKMEGAT